MWPLKKFTSAYLFQIAREKSCDYLLMIFMKKLRDSFNITLIGSQHIQMLQISSHVQSKQHFAGCF